jgi:hypothetical protein
VRAVCRHAEAGLTHNGAALRFCGFDEMLIGQLKSSVKLGFVTVFFESSK